ncbi:hypothetical protein CKK34_5165 [Yarrowia sp. E02]|nr:hypothetical protein CKK34_5165 [Yarrowia sp. E02]
MTDIDIYSVSGSERIFTFAADSRFHNLVELRPDSEDHEDRPRLSNEDRTEMKRRLIDFTTSVPPPPVSSDPSTAIQLLIWLYHLDVTVSSWIREESLHNLTVDVVWDEVRTMLPLRLQMRGKGLSWTDTRLAVLQSLYGYKVYLIRTDYTPGTATDPARFRDVPEWMYVRVWLLRLTGASHRACSMINQLQDCLDMPDLGTTLVSTIQNADNDSEAMKSFSEHVKEDWMRVREGTVQS